ncbi:MAG: hypothetical protein QM613_05155 [Micrococcaceae bacterium]
MSKRKYTTLAVLFAIALIGYIIQNEPSKYLVALNALTLGLVTTRAIDLKE